MVDEEKKENISSTDDEEINIDFSKVTKFFKRKKTPQEINEKIKQVEEENKERVEEIKADIEESIKKDQEEVKELEQEIKADQKEEEILKAEISELKEEKQQVKVFEKKTTSDEIDLSEIKNKTKKFFQSFKTKKSDKKDQKEGDKDEFSLNLKEIITFTKSNAKWLIPLVLIMIAIFTSTHLRVMPSYLPVTDDWAQNNVYSAYKSQISQQINQQYPNLPEQNKNALVEKEFQKVLIEQKDNIQQQVKSNSQYLKSKFQDENGQTYLLAIDPYFWYAEARNYVRYGQLGDSYNEEGERIFSLRNGREGSRTTKIPFHPLFGAWLYKIINFFSKDISLMAVFFYIPVIIIGLSLIPAFFIGKRVAGNLGGFFAAMLIAVNSALLNRTPAGFSDTDAYNIFFPLFIAWVFFESFEAKELKKKLFFGTIAGLLSGLYAVAWLGYWYIVGFVLVTLIIYFVYSIAVNAGTIKYKINQYLSVKEIRNILITGGVFFFSSAFFISAFAGFNRFIYLLRAPLKTVTMKEVAITTSWPNVLTTVAEFNVIDLSSIFSQMGSSLLFWIALMGIVVLLVNKNKINLSNIVYLIGSGIYYLVMLTYRHKLNDPFTFVIVISLPIIIGLVKNIYLKEKEQTDLKYSVFLIIWLAATAYGFTQGIRFAILMVPAFALAVGIGIGFVYQYLSDWLSKGIHVNKTISKTILIILFCLLLISPIKAAESTGKFEVPSMNDAWYDSLTKIKENTEDAIITSWWDFGHWFYAVSERRVTFDGAGQGERIHWVGKSLLTPDEKVSVGLLRMLNCGQQKPPHVLEEFFDGDTIKAVDVLNKMMVLNDKNKAVGLLKKERLTNDQIVKIIEVTYCDDLIDQFYIASEDMVGKAGVWGHFGSWDFERAAMYQAVSKNKEQGRQILVDQFGLSEEEADKYYYQITTTGADQWVSTWPGYQGSTGCGRDGNILKCNFDTGRGTAQLQIDLETMEASVPTNNDPAHPNSIVYATKNGIEEKKYEDNLIGMSVVLLPESNEIILTHPLQAKSIFTQLFFFNGHGLKCFSKFDERQQITGGKIQVWKADFDCQQENKVYFQPKEKEVTEIHASHILISTEERSDEEALELIKEIQEKVTVENFAELAQEYSDGPSSVKGGNLGWFGKGQMVPEFEQAAFSLEQGEISEPVKTQFGYHLILVLEKRET